MFPRDKPYISWRAEKQRLKQIAALKEEEQREQSEAEKNERYRYLPGSYRAFDDLAESIGRAQAQLIQDLIREMIAERHE